MLLGFDSVSDLTLTLFRIIISYGYNPVGQIRTDLGLCRIGSLDVDAQQEAPYAFSPRIYHLNCYAVPRLLIFSLSGHQPEKAQVRYLETCGALNSRSIQGISQLLLMIQSVQLQK